MAIKITLDRPGLRAVSRFAAKKDVRFYLVGIRIESNPMQTRMIGCDGHTLAVHRADAKGDNEGAWEGIIPLDAVNTLLKLKATHKSLANEPITLTVQDAGEIRADWCGQSLNFRPVDGTYPDYKRVIPRTVSGESAWYQPEYLQRIEDAAADLGIGKSYDFRFNGTNSSLATIGSNMIAIIMPMHDMLAMDTIGTEWAYSDLPQPEAQPEAETEIPA
jgi:DNA polymerase-3 subunit beta